MQLGLGLTLQFDQIEYAETVVAPPDLTDNLLAWYPLLADLDDTSGNNTALTDNDGPTTFGANGAIFDATNYLTHPRIITASPWSISLWVTRKDDIESELYTYFYQQLSTALLQSITSNPNWIALSVLDSGIPSVIDTEVHIVVTYDASSVLSIYINGVLKSAAYSSCAYVPDSILYLGKDTPCTIRQLGIWNKVLTIVKIQLLYNSGTPFDPTDV